MSQRSQPPREPSSRETFPGRALPPATGEALLKRIAQGEAPALETLYQMCGDRFYSMARHMVHDDGAAREIVQDCFLKIWNRAGSYDPSLSKPFTWAVMILRGLCLDHLRHASRRLPASIQLPSAEPVNAQIPLADLHLHETLSLVRKSLATLTSTEQEAITAALFEPATCHDLAERWQMPPGSVKTRIHRAMQKLRALVRPHLDP